MSQHIAAIWTSAMIPWKKNSSCKQKLVAWEIKCTMEILNYAKFNHAGTSNRGFKHDYTRMAPKTDS